MHKSNIRIVVICILLCVYVVVTPLHVSANIAGKFPCDITIEAIPASPQAMMEGDSLELIIRAVYEGDPRRIGLAARNLPDFVSGWTGNTAYCANCTVSDSIYFHPTLGSSGEYVMTFYASADFEEKLTDSLQYTLLVDNIDTTCRVEAGEDRYVTVGDEVWVEIVASTGGKRHTGIYWEFWGYPFDNGAVLESGDETRMFHWSPGLADVGVWYAHFQISTATCIARDSLCIIVEAETGDCRIPIIISEPQFTPGTFNTIYYIPACSTVAHEICYFDTRHPEIIIGCHESDWRKSVGDDDTLSFTYEDLEDGHTYGYFVKAYFEPGPDSFTISALTYSTQDASPPDTVDEISARALAGGFIRLDWFGVTDRVSYVKQYNIYRRIPGQQFAQIHAIPATGDNDEETEYTYTESLDDGSGLIEGQAYIYKVCGVDAVGNIGVGLEAGPVTPDSTAPCIPEIRIDYDSRLMYTYFVGGVESRVWGRSNCPGLQEAHFIRFEAGRDSAKYIEMHWDPNYVYFASDWLEYSPDSLDWLCQLLPPNGDTSYVHGHQYYYRAQAKDSLGNTSTWSGTIKAWQDAYPPSDIGGIQAHQRMQPESNSFSVEIIWQAATDTVSGVKQYYIYRKIDDGEYHVIDSTIDTSHVDQCDGMVTRRRLCYAIGSCDFVGNVRDYHRTEWEACVHPHAGPIISAACDTVLFDSVCYTADDVLIISWADYDTVDVIGFSAVCNGETLSRPGASPDYMTIPAPVDGAYDVSVQATYFDGTVSTWSNTVSVVRDGTPPEPVAYLTVHNDSLDCNGYMDLNWEASLDNTGIGHYVIIRTSVEQDREDTVAISDVTSWVDSCQTLTVYEDYIYRVVPVDLLGNVQWYNNAADTEYCNRPPLITEYSQDGSVFTFAFDRAIPNLAEDWLDVVRIYRNDEVLPLIDGSMVWQGNSWSVDLAEYGAGYYTMQVREIVEIGGDSLGSAWSCPFTVPYDMPPPPVASFELQSQPTPPGMEDEPVGRVFLAWTIENTQYLDSIQITRTSPLGRAGINVTAECLSYMDSGLYAFTNIWYQYCIRTYDIFGQTSEAVCKTAIFDPYWMFTPQLTLNDASEFFNTGDLTVVWTWLDSDFNRADTTYGAVDCQVEVDIAEDFSSGLKTAGPWMTAFDTMCVIDVLSLSPENNRTLYCRIRARDKWGHESCWSDGYFGSFVRRFDNWAPTVIEHVSYTTSAVNEPIPNLLDVSLSWSRSVDLGNESGFSHYKVYCDMATGVWDSIGSPTDTFLTDDSVSVIYDPGYVYRYKIQPMDNIGNEREHENQEIVIQILPVPDSLTALSREEVIWWYSEAVPVQAFCVERSKNIDNLDAEFVDDFGGIRELTDGNVRTATFPHVSNFDNADTVYFHIKAIGEYCQSAWSEIFTYPPRQSKPPGNNPPAKLTLHQNHPNPFNASTEIYFDLPKAGDVRLDVYNIRGQLVKSLLHCRLTPDSYYISWDGTNQRGKDVASGIYFYQLRTETGSVSKKMLLLR